MLHQLRDLNDIELAGLIGCLGELQILSHTLNAGGRAVSGALGEAVAEAHARKSGGAHRERLFRADRPVRFEELSAFRELVERGADALTERGFDQAGACLRRALDLELCVDSTSCQPHKARELRHLN